MVRNEKTIARHTHTQNLARMNEPDKHDKGRGNDDADGDDDI